MNLSSLQALLHHFAYFIYDDWSYTLCIASLQQRLLAPYSVWNFSSAYNEHLTCCLGDTWKMACLISRVHSSPYYKLLAWNHFIYQPVILPHSSFYLNFWWQFDRKCVQEIYTGRRVMDLMEILISNRSRKGNLPLIRCNVQFTLIYHDCKISISIFVVWSKVC